MNNMKEFYYYLQGFCEIANQDPTVEQWNKIIKLLIEVKDHDNDGNFSQARDFVNWLSGFVELCPKVLPANLQWQMIKDHLQLVFTKVTPEYTSSDIFDEIKTRIGPSSGTRAFCYVNDSKDPPIMTY